RSDATQRIHDINARASKILICSVRDQREETITLQSSAFINSCDALMSGNDLEPPTEPSIGGDEIKSTSESTKRRAHTPQPRSDASDATTRGATGAVSDEYSRGASPEMTSNSRMTVGHSLNTR